MTRDAGPRITFLTTLRTNVGDDFIREGIRAVLDRLLPAYRPLYVNKHDPASLSRREEDEPEPAADKIAGCDLLVQSGAPVYWHLSAGKHTSTTAEWHGWLWEQRTLSAAPEGSTGRPVFVNLGAGSTFPWGDDGAAFLADAACAAFTRRLGRRAALTTVRDDVAGSILSALEVPHRLLPCPAFLAGARRPSQGRDPGLIGVNLMRRAGHFVLDPALVPATWAAACRQMLAGLRKRGRIRFICHDEAERQWAEKLATPGEEIIISGDWRAYLEAYAPCAAVVANRVHGAVAAAGLGVPSIILGNDTRARIGGAIGMPVFRAAELAPVDVVRVAERFIQKGEAERSRLAALRERTLDEYAALLRPVVRDLGRGAPASGSRAVLNRAG
jgi:hypothetical protein